MDLTRLLGIHSLNAPQDSNAFQLEGLESQVHKTYVLNSYGALISENVIDNRHDVF